MAESNPGPGRYPEDELDKVIDSQHFGIHKHLGMIADSMAEWEGPIANQLQLSPADVAMIKTKHPSHLKLQCRTALHTWKKRCGHEATYRHLIEVFKKAGYDQYSKIVKESLTEGDKYHQKLVESVEQRTRAAWTPEKMMAAKPRTK